MTRNTPARGFFLTLEGIEGAGKSTQIDVLATHLRARDIQVTLTREPGGAPIAERLRSVLLDPANAGMDDTAELLLMFAARAEHLDKTIRPALDAGRWVICDRFTDATYAYQGGGRGGNPDRISVLETLVQGALRPNLTLLFDLPPSVGLARARARSGKSDRFEAEDLRFFEAVRAVYLDRADVEPGRFRVIDACAPCEEVSRQLRSILDGFIDGLTASHLATGSG